jgi:hypothetical protein
MYTLILCQYNELEYTTIMDGIKLKFLCTHILVPSRI